MIGELLPAALQFRQKLTALRAGKPQAFEWYPYESLTNAGHLDRLLAGNYEAILGVPGASGILDIGCADGDLAFLLESLGYPVTAIDHPSTNHNGMLGIRTLRNLLGSSVEILEADIDSQFTLPPNRFRLAVFLGILYHLKNPFHALERLAKSCDYCVLSTRIARQFPDGAVMPPQHPMAYLLAPDELNADDSNYWIFNEAGLRRLISRTHWEVVEFFTGGDTSRSNPTSREHDERAFCLLRSRYGMANVKLGPGFHEPEDTGWRWVASSFSVRVDQPRETLTVKGFLPETVLQALGAVRLSVSVNGRNMAPIVLGEAGAWTLVRRLGGQGSAGTEVHFSTDKALPASASDGRERALIIASVDFE